MKVVFTGDPVELERGEGLSRLSTTLFGVTFPMSQEVDVSHLPDKQKQKLLNNQHFRAAGVDAVAPPPLVMPSAGLVIEPPAPKATAKKAAKAEA